MSLFWVGVCYGVLRLLSAIFFLGCWFVVLYIGGSFDMVLWLFVFGSHYMLGRHCCVCVCAVVFARRVDRVLGYA